MIRENQTEGKGSKMRRLLKLMMRRLLKLIWGAMPVVMILLLIMILGGAIGSKTEALKAEKAAAMGHEALAVNVVTLKMKPMSLRDRINLPGVVEPWVKLTVSAEVKGKVIRKPIEKGLTVAKGDIIAELDDRDYRNALQAAKASYQTAVSTRDRLEKLFHEKLATRSQLDAAEAEVENYQSQKDIALLNLQRCTIRSPIDGVVNNLFFEEGQYVNFSDPVAEVLQLDPVKVVVGIPESDVNAVRDVKDFEVTIDALGTRYKAKKRFLSRSTDPMARLYRLELTIDNPDRTILPDMFARVEIVKKEIHDTLAVPLYSVVSVGDESVVYVARNGVAHPHPVSMGLQEGWLVQINDGLKTDDEVVVVGHRSVSEGQRINVVKTITDPGELQR